MFYDSVSLIRYSELAEGETAPRWAARKSEHMQGDDLLGPYLHVPQNIRRYRENPKGFVGSEEISSTSSTPPCREGCAEHGTLHCNYDYVLCAGQAG